MVLCRWIHPTVDHVVFTTKKKPLCKWTYAVQTPIFLKVNCSKLGQSWGSSCLFLSLKGITSLPDVQGIEYHFYHV